MMESVPTLEKASVEICSSDDKGRYLKATVKFATGSVLFQDKAFVYATYDTTPVAVVCEEEDCNDPEFCVHNDDNDDMIDMNEDEKGDYTDAIARQFSDILTFCVEKDVIAEVDRAKCILKCITMFTRNANSLDELLKLSCANENECLDCAESIRKEFPKVVPHTLTNSHLAKIIGVLNTNSHELETLGGTGLFLSACLMEHNCLPNCSFTTVNDTLWVNAIRDIADSEPLSIDYGNLFYRPTAERLEMLESGYGFTCKCNACTLLEDKCRAYKCNQSSCTGIVHPRPVNSVEKYICSQCKSEYDDTTIAKITSMEKSILENIPESIEEIDQVVETTLFHKYHYILFWALDAIGCVAATVDPSEDESEDSKHNNSLKEIWKRIIESLNYVIPYAHHEKTIYYDNLAQVQIICGDISGAQEAYKTAYEISCIVSGTDTEPTLQLKNLMENPPRTREEIIAIYGHEMDYDDDGMEDEEFDESDNSGEE